MESILVLYIDEQPAKLDLVQKSDIPVTVTNAYSGKEALEKLKISPPQIIVLSQNLPDTSGADLLKKIRKLGIDAHRILLAENGDTEVLEQVDKTVAVHWFNKRPYNSQKLEHILRKAITDWNLYHTIQVQEGKYRDAFESMSDVFTRSDMEGTCLMVSPSIYDLLGYKPDEILGKNLATFYANPEKRTEIIEILKESKKVQSFEFDAICKNGTRIKVSTNAKLYYDTEGNPLGVLGNIRDITQQKRAESEHNKLFNYSFDLLCIAGMDGYFKELNPSWEKVTGYSLKELYSKPYLEFIHPEDREKTLSEIDALSKGIQTIDFENRYMKKNGELLHLSWTAIAESGGNFLYSIARDVTARHSVEKKVLEYQQRLKALAHELTVSEEKTKKQIALDLHDHVGQLLSSIRMQLSRIYDLIENDQIRIRINTISQSLLLAIQSTRDAIFNLSLPELNELGLVAAIENWMRTEVEGKHNIKTNLTGEELRIDLNEDTRLLVFRSVRELMTNVMKHSRADRMEVMLNKMNGSLEITVEDNGVGFNYNPDLVRLKTNTFGLFSIQERMSDLGGSMSVDSDLSKGTRAKIIIPLEEHSYGK